MPIRSVARRARTAFADRSQIPELAETIEAMRSEIAAMRTDLQSVRAITELIYEEETANARALAAVRETDGYQAAYDEEEPLVSVVIATYTNHELLKSRALPSVLAQSYTNFEVIVVGDGAPPDAASAVASFGDPRIRYDNLTVRPPYPTDEKAFWYVAGCIAGNRALAMARGRWITFLGDDDSMRPDLIATLLKAARERRAELVYGQILKVEPDGTETPVYSFPPASYQYGLQATLVHGELKFIDFKLGTGYLDVPQDWAFCRKLMRAGARIEMIDDVLADYYPSKVWAGRDRKASLPG